MKNFLYWSAASIAALALTSCAQEEIQPVNPDGLTTIEITLPEQIATRYGEGDKATNLFVAVYPKGANDVLMTNLNGAQEGLTVNNFAPGSLTTTVQIQLVKIIHTPLSSGPRAAMQNLHHTPSPLKTRLLRLTTPG